MADVDVIPPAGSIHIDAVPPDPLPVITPPSFRHPLPSETTISPGTGDSTIFDTLHNVIDFFAHKRDVGEAHHDNLLHSWFGIDVSAYKPDEYWYVVLILLLFILPQLFTRLRIPSAITTLGMGVVASMGLGLFHGDSTIDLLSLFGIVSLFLFAGMEVDFRELRQHKKVLSVHMLVCLSALAGVAFAIIEYFHIGVKPALIISLALLTPSTGFILSSLKSFGLHDDESRHVKMNAIASELLALIVLFFCVQSGDTHKLLLAVGAVVGLIIALPVALWLYAKFIAQYAPRSSFAFIMILAILASWATKNLGAYYLLGAFITGIVAMRMSKVIPELESKEVIHSIELFASFFIPFYFFHAGLELDASYFGYESLLWGGIFLGICLPLRMMYMIGHRLPLAGESFRISNRIAVTMLPTLVFTLVLTGLLRDQHSDVISERPWLIGGLIIYTLINTLVPGFFLSGKGKSFDVEHFHLSSRFVAKPAIKTANSPTQRKPSSPSLPTAALEPKSGERPAVPPPVAQPASGRRPSIPPAEYRTPLPDDVPRSPD